VCIYRSRQVIWLDPYGWLYMHTSPIGAADPRCLALPTSARMAWTFILSMRRTNTTQEVLPEMANLASNLTLRTNSWLPRGRYSYVDATSTQLCEIDDL
jgi:hypothetical protein